MKIWDIIKLIFFIPVAYWWCDISPFRHYDWLDGIWHGLNFYGNLVLSIFSDAIVKSPNGTIGYNISWWIVVGFTLLLILLGIIVKIGLIKVDDENTSTE